MFDTSNYVDKKLVATPDVMCSAPQAKMHGNLSLFRPSMAENIFFFKSKMEIIKSNIHLLLSRCSCYRR